MKLIISERIAQRYPDLRIGVLKAEDIQNRSKLDELEEIKAQKAAQFRKRYRRDTLLEHPHIAAWRETYRSFGAKPKKYKPTAEALLRRILSGVNIPTISAVVDSYLVVETEYLLPIGGYDLDKIAGNITLRFSEGGEEFQPLGSQATETTKPGEVVYCDDARVLTRRWNYRDCDATKITIESRRIGLFIEAAERTIESSALIDGLNSLEGYVSRFCGGQIKTFVADASEGLEWEI